MRWAKRGAITVDFQSWKGGGNQLCRFPRIGRVQRARDNRFRSVKRTRTKIHWPLFQLKGSAVCFPLLLFLLLLTRCQGIWNRGRRISLLYYERDILSGRFFLRGDAGFHQVCGESAAKQRFCPFHPRFHLLPLHREVRRKSVCHEICFGIVGKIEYEGNEGG